MAAQNGRAYFQLAIYTTALLFCAEPSVSLTEVCHLVRAKLIFRQLANKQQWLYSYTLESICGAVP